MKGSPQQKKASFEELEICAEHYDVLKPVVNKLERQDLEVSNWEKTNRINEFTRLLGDKSKAEQADKYFSLKLGASKEPKIAIVRFSPWLIAGRSELATALLGDIARSAGHVLGSPIRDAFSAVLQRLSDIAPLASAGANAALSGAGSFFLHRELLQVNLRSR